MRPAYILLIVFAAAELFLLSAASGQESSPRRGVGLTASLQESQIDIMMPIWVGDKVSIAPAVGFLWVENAGSELRLGIVSREYFTKEKFAPYFGGRLVALISSPDVGTKTTDMLLGLSGGGEYFLDDHFSVGVEAQLNATKSSDQSLRFGNPGRWNVNTGSAVFATVYF
jgi:hypothetical protein